MQNFRQRSASAHHFGMVPRADIPRAAFRMQRSHKTTFNGGFLVPVMLEEVLPGDSWSVSLTAFARLATPIFPLMDNLHIDTFFFFVPNRLVWSNWQRFQGERDDPDDSIDFTVPVMTYSAAADPQPSPANLEVGSLFDYFGLPLRNDLANNGVLEFSALPFRGYKLIYNEWFRDQNLMDSEEFPRGDSGDEIGDQVLLYRGKRHDYFTSCLPWPLKGGVSVSVPLGESAPVLSDGTLTPFTGMTSNDESYLVAPNSGNPEAAWGTVPPSAQAYRIGDPSNVTGLYADLTEATAATINQLRQAFQIQRLLERDARGGTRYTEILRAHWGVVSPDARLQRPEYLGGGTQPMVITPIAQTSGTQLESNDSPLATLAGVGTSVGRHGFSQSFTEHGYLFGLINVRADLSYQQGMRRHWSRQTRYDFAMPVFAHLGEQAVLRKEIFARGTADDDLVFGYQERWAEYRYSPSMITGLFRSTADGTLDAWHLAERFTPETPPVLSEEFMWSRPPIDRVLAVPQGDDSAQIIFDGFFDMRVARALPLYSVPGMIDHF